MIKSTQYGDSDLVFIVSLGIINTELELVRSASEKVLLAIREDTDHQAENECQQLLKLCGHLLNYSWFRPVPLPSQSVSADSNWLMPTDQHPSYPCSFLLNNKRGQEATPAPRTN